MTIKFKTKHSKSELDGMIVGLGYWRWLNESYIKRKNKKYKYPRLHLNLRRLYGIACQGRDVYEMDLHVDLFMGYHDKKAHLRPANVQDSPLIRQELAYLTSKMKVTLI